MRRPSTLRRSPVQSGAGTGWRKGGSSVPSPKTPATKVAGVLTAEPSSRAPRVPVSPLATVSHVSTSRSRKGSKPLTSKRQAGSSVGAGKCRSATFSRRLIWSSRMASTASGPPPATITRGGAPADSGPTETTTDRASSGTSVSPSPPSIPPGCPNSSPMTSTSSGSRPRSPTSVTSTARAASPLSVSPMTTCLMSLPTRACGRPASTAYRRASSSVSVRPCTPACPSVISTCCHIARAPARDGSDACGIRSITRRLSRTSVPTFMPPAASLSVRRPAASSSASSSPALAWRRRSSRGPVGPTANTSEPRERNRRSRPSTSGRARSASSTSLRPRSLTTATSTPSAVRRSRRPRSAPGRARRSAMAVPSHSRTSTANSRSSAWWMSWERGMPYHPAPSGRVLHDEGYTSGHGDDRSGAPAESGRCPCPSSTSPTCAASSPP